MKNKAKNLAQKIGKLPAIEQKAVKEYYAEHPEKVWSEQKSLLKGFSDLPLFAKDENQERFDFSRLPY